MLVTFGNYSSDMPLTNVVWAQRAAEGLWKNKWDSRHPNCNTEMRDNSFLRTQLTNQLQKERIWRAQLSEQLQQQEHTHHELLKAEEKSHTTNWILIQELNSE